MSPTSLLTGFALLSVGLYTARNVTRSLEPRLLILPAGGPEPAGPIPRPTAPPAPASLGPTRLTSDPLPLSPGSRYAASVRLSTLASALATTDRVRSQAEKAGFSNVVVSETPFASPPLAKGDYYVAGTFTGAPSAFSREQGGGRVAIVDAWRIS